MDIMTIVGIAASAATAVSLIPQLIKTVKEKKAESISLGMMVILFAGLGLWIYYGVLKRDVIIIASNALSITINLLLAIFTLKYKRNKAAV